MKPPPLAYPVTADRLLRSWGFAIASRPKDGEPTWRDRLTGKVMTETAAVALVLRREKAARSDR